MARNALEFPSVNDTQDHEIRIFDDAGGQIGAVLPATHSGPGTYNYFVTVPAALATGWYAYNAYQSNNGRLRSSGDFYWDNAGNCIIDTEEVELTQADVVTALGTYGAATATDVSNAETNILAAIPTAAAIAVQVEAALINDADGQTALAAIAQAVETAIGNETDGNATIAAFQGAVTAALVANGIATGAEVTACCDDIQADIAALNNLSQADINSALVSFDVATATDVTTNAGLTPGQAAILTLLRDIAEADEIYTNTTAQKLLKGTSTVLVDKTVTTATPCTINTTITET